MSGRIRDFEPIERAARFAALMALARFALPPCDTRNELVACLKRALRGDDEAAEAAEALFGRVVARTRRNILSTYAELFRPEGR